MLEVILELFKIETATLNSMYILVKTSLIFRISVNYIKRTH